MVKSHTFEILDIEQGSPEWHSLRKTKITATDAAVIMGVSPWKSKTKLYQDKKSDDAPNFVSEKMQRGIDLEPIARDLFIIQSNIEVEPKVIVKDWAMASLDGMSEDGKHIVEIKCPGEKDHQSALSGKVPDYYYPQLQHQMFVCDVDEMYYYSFDGADGVILTVKRDNEFIEKMIIEEKKFYDCLMTDTPPEPDENDYVERTDLPWEKCALNWLLVTSQIKELEKIEEDLRKQLISLSGESNSRGAGISLCQVQRKGNVDYSKIPELKGVDLELYRKSAITTWRITYQ